jgi:Xaa-Pro aminopeptidase
MMRTCTARALFVALSLCALGSAAPATSGDIRPDEFRSRRAALRKSLDGAMVLFGQREGSDVVFHFRQEPNFFYLTGWTEPGAILLITSTEETLFLPHHDEHAERFLGKRSSAEDQNAREVTGFERVMPVEKFESEQDQALSRFAKLYSLGGGLDRAKLQARYAFRDINDAAAPIAKLRVKKSPAELAAIQHATDVTIEAHGASWKRIEPGMYEHQLSAILMGVYLDRGCEGVAYDPIVGSGPNGAVLHYFSGARRMDRGEVVVMDSAAECGGYASDITRTIPAGGKFSKRQRELYQVVLGAQKAAIAAIKPGIRMGGEDNSVTKIVKDYLNAHGKDSHGEPLGKYFTHGLGHPVGLQVHDPNVDGPLEAGMVVTVEPGLYIPEEGIGIRIEDVVLVTENGAKVLSAALPKEPDEIEAALAK